MFRFKKRIKIFPGIYINFGKSGFTSMSIGGYNTKTKKTTVNLPVSGMNYQIDHNKKESTNTGEYTSATVRLDRETMEDLKKHTKTSSNKACIEAIVEDYIKRLS